MFMFLYKCDMYIDLTTGANYKKMKAIESEEEEQQKIMNKTWKQVEDEGEEEEDVIPATINIVHCLWLFFNSNVTIY